MPLARYSLLVTSLKPVDQSGEESRRAHDGRHRGKVLAALISRPEELVSAVVIVAVAIVTFLDLIDRVSLPKGSLAHFSVFVGCLLAMSLVIGSYRARSTDLAVKRTATAVAHVEASIAALVPLDAVAQIEPPMINEELKRLLGDTRSWYFRGGSGRWQRTTALPALSRITGFDVDYVMQVIDPGNRPLCERYAAYRSRQLPQIVRRQNEGQSTQVRDDLLACIYAAGWYAYNSRVIPRIFLSAVYSPVRIDMGTQGLMATVADPAAPALLCRSGNWLNTAFSDELAQWGRELPQIMFPAASDHLYPADQLKVTAERVRDCISNTQVRLGGNTRPLFVDSGWLPEEWGPIADFIFPQEEHHA